MRPRCGCAKRLNKETPPLSSISLTCIGRGFVSRATSKKHSGYFVDLLNEGTSLPNSTSPPSINRVSMSSRIFKRRPGGYREAATHGVVKAAYRLGWMYARGNGVPQD